MINTGGGAALLLLSAMAGAFHVIAPDHWFPASFLAWRRRWSLGRTLLFAIAVYVVHVALGLAVFFAFEDFFVGAFAERLAFYTIALVCLAGWVRALRFWRAETPIRSAPSSTWAIGLVLSLLGPCESIIPILVKSQQLGHGYGPAVCAFLAGTLVMGSALVLAGRAVWDRPELFARWMGPVRLRVAPLPAAGVMALGLVYLLK